MRANTGGNNFCPYGSSDILPSPENKKTK